MDPLPAFKRNYLLCPVCKKTWDCLSVHLRRVCMKTHDEDAIEAAVERAKAEMRVLLATGRVFKYGRLCQIVAAADPVSRLIEEGVAFWCRRTSESSGETFQCYRDVQWKNPARKLMTEKGLYKKHSIDHALLRFFFSFLQTDLQNENPKQEVERFLCYMDPRAPSLEFVRDREKTQQFLTYQTINTNLRHDDKDLHTDCREFIDYLGLLQKISKEITQKRHERLTAEAELATHDCTAVLRAAKEDFLAISQKMLSEKEVTTDECLDYMYYLQALVILKHLQRPGVVSHMTVPEWLNKKKTTTGYTVVGVKEHKTSAQQVATFALSQEEDTWFELYYTCVRPQLQSCIRKRIREVIDGTEERFFYLVPSGRIHNPSNDLQRLHISIARSAAQQKAETTDLQMDLEAAYNLSNGAR
ncbi:hypothetical protein AMELA_G00037320 [Ameiurus melas]|uniref:Uncharacterized protein n=1 Tax=Ameiurus melas TaxID=219545 RepID=A0A7J6B8U1_AMEME|nr:hypothetical protein AMELA_G00037320 [Ameiurus melas]